MPSHQLCTTALTEFWNLQAKRIVFLGSWCLRYDRREVWQKLDYEVLPHPWDDREAMHKAALYEEEVSELVLESMVEFLNDVHGEKHNNRYWRIILAPWLIHYIQTMHERYLCLKLAFDLFPDLTTTCLAPTSFKVPRYVRDHVVGSTEDAYNLQIYSSLLQSMGYHFPKRELLWDWMLNPYAQKKHMWKDEISRIRTLWNKANLFLARKAKILMVDMYLPPKQIFHLMAATKFSAWICVLPTSKKWIDNLHEVKLHPLREELKNLPVKRNDAFVSTLIKTLPEHFPLVYLEGYAYCRNLVKRIRRNCSIKAIMTSSGLSDNEILKFLTAEFTEKGLKIINAQHGAFYGNACYISHENYERKASDEFWSWGWGEDDDDIVPMPSPRLSNLAKKRKIINRRKKYILFSGNSFPRYHFRTWSCPTANQVLLYIEWQILFIQMLNVQVRQSLIFRLHPSDWGWNSRQRLGDACPDLKIVGAKGSYANQLLKAELVICDMNQSTFSDSLAANIPTIAFWNPQFSEIRPKAAPYFEILNKAGILHYSPEEAGKTVNTLWPQIEDWWLNKEVQQARKKFAERFALHSPQWLYKWSTRLSKSIADISEID